MILAFLAALVGGTWMPPAYGASPARIAGVKIYETRRDAADLFQEWRSLGINTVFASVALNRDGAFREEARRSGVARYVILPLFFDPEALAADPDLYAVTAAGAPAREEWVEFVCPSRAAFRRRKIEWIKGVIRDTQPDGLSLDFVRHFVFWEKVYPDRAPDSLPDTCFDPSCLGSFQKETGVTLPAHLKTPAQASRYIHDYHQEAWIRWKCGLITSLVRDVVAEARALKPGIMINLHAVPWRRTDFGGALRAVAGQDLGSLAAHVDFVSPMTYAHMVQRPPTWVHSVVEDVAAQVDRPVLPSIQVGKAYLETPLSVEEFERSLDAALEPPSAGVIFWSWQALEDEPAKKAIVGRVLARVRP